MDVMFEVGDQSPYTDDEAEEIAIVDDECDDSEVPLGSYPPSAAESHSDRQFKFTGLSDGIISDGFISEDMTYTHVAEDAISYITKAPKIIGRFLLGEKLGEGSYGKVKEALDTQTLQRRAVKIIKNRKVRKFPNGQEHVRNEIKFLRSLRHKNVIELIDVVYNHPKEKIYMFMDYCHGNLEDLVKDCAEGGLPEWQAHLYFVQLLDALAYIHSQGIIHKDVKPGNILIQGIDVIKLSDFGVASRLDRYSSSTQCQNTIGTPAFQSPELVRGDQYVDGPKVDVWASGVTLFHLVTGTYPFDGDNVIGLYDNIAQAEFELPAHVQGQLAEAIRFALTKEFEHRPTALELKTHLWCSTTPKRVGDRVQLGAEQQDPFSSTVLTSLSELYDMHSYEEFISDPPSERAGSFDQSIVLFPHMQQVGENTPAPERHESHTLDALERVGFEERGRSRSRGPFSPVSSRSRSVASNISNASSPLTPKRSESRPTSESKRSSFRKFLSWFDRSQESGTPSRLELPPTSPSLRHQRSRSADPSSTVLSEEMGQALSEKMESKPSQT
eukprot:m.95732 g.95732  ORF g.95732 m.95732 type:complete len:556 (+) comp13062_c0_seq7:3504-5171(+)